MGGASNALRIGGDLLIVCLILTVGFTCGRMSNQMSQASAAVINQNTVEYREADVSSLLATSHSGASVKQYINKYRRNMGVELLTLKAFAAGQHEMKIDAKTSLASVGDKDNLFFVSDDAIFFCEADKDSNGNYKTIRFIQNGVQNAPSPDDDVSSPDDAKIQLITVFGGNSRMTWNEIVRAARNDIQASSGAKQTLVNELNKYLVNSALTPDSSWDDVVSLAETLLSDYKDSLDGAVNSARHNRTAFSIAAGDSRTLNFSPTVVIVVNDATGEKSVWSSDNGSGWIVGTPPVGISGRSISNNDTDNPISVICYN